MVDTRWVSRLDGHSTSLALLATTSADSGERQFYRQDAADMFLPPNAVDQLPWESLRAILISADALAAGTTPDLAIAVGQHAGQRGIEVWWDLDWRGNSWATPSAYHTKVAPVVSGADVVIDTEEEFANLIGLTERHSQHAFTTALAAFPAQTKVLKRGASGATMWTTVPGISVPVTRTTRLHRRRWRPGCRSAPALPRHRHRLGTVAVHRHGSRRLDGFPARMLRRVPHSDRPR